MNNIHHTSIIGPNVILGKNNYIGPYCYITGNIIIGDNNRFEGYCSIGTSAEHRNYFDSSLGKLSIGSNNTIREFTTINAGTNSVTILKDNIVMLRNSHIGHDCILESKINLSCNVILGGHSHLMEGCNFGLGAICHQFSIIGAYSMIGMGTIITKSSSIEPGKVYVGSPAKYLKDNKIGLERNNITQSLFNEIITKYQTLCLK